MNFAKLRLHISKVFGTGVLLVFCFSDNKLEESIISDIFFFIGITLVGLGVIGRIWCSMYISGYKNKVLVTAGPYSICRNPLYFFSFLGVIGVGFTTETITIPLLILCVFAFYYPFVIKSEEKNLLGIFGEDFVSYTKKVPKFFPKFSNYSEPKEYTVKPRRFKNFLMEVIWFIWLVGFIEIFEGLKERGFVHIYFHII